MISLALFHPNLYCLVAAEEEWSRVVFLYQLVRGKASNSYGLNVAALAGLSPEILRRAGQKAKELRAEALHNAR